MTRTVLLSLVLSFSLAVQQSQAQVRFEAVTEVRQVAEGQYFEIIFLLSNASGKNFQPPSFRDFEVLSGPNQTMNTSIVNGVVSREQGVSYTLLAKKSGKYTIGKASISVDGKRLNTLPVTIEVVPPKKSSGLKGETSEPIFLLAELNDSVAYVGQQVLVDYKIYTSKDIDSYNLISESEYGGLYSQEVRRFESRLQREVLNGEPYSTKILRRVALFPQQTGRFEIGPMTLQLGVVVEEQDPRRSIFFLRDIEFINVSSQPVTLEVRPLPSDAPEDFSGAVGRYFLEMETGPLDISTDDALSVKFRITGNGDSKRVLPQKLQLPTTFEVYPPKLSDEKTAENGGEIVHSKTLEYLATPHATGEFTILPGFVYFDTDSAKYVSLLGDTLRVNVVEGSRTAAGLNRLVPVDSAALEPGPLLQKTKFQKSGQEFFGSPVFWILLTLPIVCSAGAWWWQRQKDKEEKENVSHLKYRQAESVARKRLLQAKEWLDAGQPGAFYDEISKASWGYVCDKLQIPPAELTKSGLREKLLAVGIPETLIDRYMQVLNVCEVALFAGRDNPAAMDDVYKESFEVITAMEEYLR